jgi:hypothetical protein
VVKVLLARKADTNLENADTLETCLHLACTTYRDDPDGKRPFYFRQLQMNASMLINQPSAA